MPGGHYLIRFVVFFVVALDPSGGGTGVALGVAIGMAMGIANARIAATRKKWAEIRKSADVER
jgi:hypothetical protein